ncbi:hypothetical protein Emtol_1443 [Emticicia oligotrophica DSM 17448]|uniref:UPF0323 domain-containing protein n=1 Tax=Emticicia oligotrophica (strain DSM 17448 / CIP 109782 / MTCC 6937 / GPTSA100-15) TaxID=929562 RepID=A0ABN4ALQ2_EMTOG|nr:hypothetical protein [Emticicia oligotrophica]AFK02589.1 hypothetical protein Emtol_1443 [Emticicia oligotrophica DSM 17448]
MTPISKKTFIRKVKDITIGSTLAITILGNTMVLQSCGSDSTDEEYEYEEVYTKGVKTYIKETEKGVFKITDEKEVPIDSSVAIVTYLDGKKDSLSPKVVQGLIDSEVKNSPNTIGQSSNLSNALLFGGMGYLLAKTMSPNYASYRPDVSGFQNNNSTSKADTARHRRNHYYGGRMMSYYASSSAFNKSTQVHQNIGSSRTTMARPVGGRSGFFHSSGHSSHSS